MKLSAYWQHFRPLPFDDIFTNYLHALIIYKSFTQTVHLQSGTLSMVEKGNNYQKVSEPTGMEMNDTCTTFMSQQM